MKKINTKKVYQIDQYINRINAKIVEITEGFVELDQTVAYPEGGGQESDRGWIETPAGMLHFDAVKLLHGTPITLEGFDSGKTGGIIVHQVALKDCAILASLIAGMDVTVHIDIQRRQRLTLSHSASHFLYAAVLAFRPELKNSTIGCHIKENGARFDFLSSSSFLPEEIQCIAKYANEMIARNHPIRIEVHPENNDARIWVYEDIRIACGGTHLFYPEDIGYLQVARKKIGKNKERLICTFDNERIRTETYHAIEMSRQ